MARMRQSANWRDQTGTRGRHRIAPGRIEGRQTMMSRLTGAIVRAVLVVLTIALPSILLPGTPAATTQTVALVSLVAAIFTIVEYQSNYPSLVEFRAAPPFNRLRFLALFLTVFGLSLISRGELQPSTLTTLSQEVGTRIGQLMDIPYSPVRLIVLILPPNADQALVEAVRTAAGLSYFVSIAVLLTFVVCVRFLGWPSSTGGFNVWINLPTFDPTSGGDVVSRLNRDAQFNLILGFLLPFLIPALVKLASDYIDPVNLANPHTLIWTMTAWAFLPSGLLMRGIALNRVAEMISRQRERAYARAEAEEGGKGYAVT